MNLRKIRDGISPALIKKAKAAGPSASQRHLKAMGRAVISVSKRAFTDSSLRPTAWVPRLDSLPHVLLQKSTMLRKSIRVISVSNGKVVVGSDRKYAVIHQLGGKAGRKRSAKIPARPYMPFKQSRLSPAGKRAVERALVASLRSSGL